EPWNDHKLVDTILQFELKINVVLAGTDDVQDIDIRLHQSPKLKSFAVFVRRNQFCFVRNRRLTPVATGRAAAAKRFEIPDVHFAAWNVGTGKGEHVVGPGDGQLARRQQFRPG